MMLTCLNEPLAWFTKHCMVGSLMGYLFTKMTIDFNDVALMKSTTEEDLFWSF